jgi:hypothetical protein
MGNIALNGSIAAILAQLTTEERNGGVVYVALEPIRAGARLEFPKTRIEVKWDALLAFVDRDPMANWSHSCRYLLLNIKTHEVESFQAALPPFSNKSVHWRVAYKAPSVPDALLAVAR